MKHLIVKELQELVREKRFPVFMTSLASILGAGSMVMLSQSARAASFGHPWAFGQPLSALMFVGLVSCVLLALTFAADAIAKERDQGMLPLLLTSPVTHLEVVGAKVAMLGAVYAAFALVNLTVAALLALAFGSVVIKATFWLLVGPLGAFYVFLAGFCMFLSATFRTSKAALAVGVAGTLPLFLLLKQGPVGYLVGAWSPTAHALLGWLPVEAAVHASLALAAGAAFDWGPLALSVLVGVAFVAGAAFVFQAREVAA